MLPRRFHSLPMLCLLVICLLTSPMRSFGYVWCLSADGHTELEAVVGGDCDRTPLAQAAIDLSALTLDDEGDDCGACLDVSPSPQWDSTRGRDGKTPASRITLSVPIAVAVLNHPVTPFFTNGLVPESSPRVYEPVLHHRTTVLLI